MIGVVARHLEAAHARAVDELHAKRARMRAEKVFETAAIELPRRRRQQLAHAKLGASIDARVPFAEEEAEAELADLLGVEVLAQAEHVGEVVRADLDGGFADLERRFAHWMTPPLEYRHR
jgi:hypothetical protein